MQQLLMLSVVTALALPASARCHLENVVEIPVEADQNKLLTKGVIDGHDARVLIDTGANLSLIWRPAIERLGLHVTTGPRVSLYGLGGESQAGSAFVKEFRVAGFTAEDRHFPVAGDLPSEVDFVLGEDFLSRTSVEFDLRHHVIRMMEPTGCAIAQLPYWAAIYSMADLIGSPRDALAIRVNVLLNGHSVLAQIDSGSSISIVAEPVANSLGIRYVPTSEEVVGIGHGSLQTWIADVQTFTLGDETIKNTKLRVAQMGKYRTMVRLGSRIPVEVAGEPEMLLGLDFLRAHRVLVDNSVRKIVFTYEGGPVFEASAPPESNTSYGDWSCGLRPCSEAAPPGTERRAQP
jgi:predicted aspartyl protease